jgi:hypothetical protein
MILALHLSLSVATASAQLPPAMTVDVATSHSVSRPLREMATCPEAIEAIESTFVLGAPLSARVTASVFAPIRFEGIDRVAISSDSCNGIPMMKPFITSDDSGAVGRFHYVQVVNSALAVYDKVGNRLAGPIATTTFWANQPDCGGNQVWSDSIVIYDRHADRWVISRPRGPDLCLAVSQTSDPTGTYDQYDFKVNNETNGLAAYFNDYPKISSWTNSYFATANPNFLYCGLGNTISAFDRSAMLTGDPKPAFVTFFVPGPKPGDTMPGCDPAPPIPRTHMLPADLDGETLPPAPEAIATFLGGGEAPGYIVQVQDEHLGFPAGRLQVYEFHVDWADPSSATLTPTTSLTPQPFNSNVCGFGINIPCIHQPNRFRLDQIAQGAMMYRLSYRNFGDHQTLLFNHTVAADGNPNSEHAGIRWY